jgi:DNA polymerase epsilon subunit 2
MSSMQRRRQLVKTTKKYGLHVQPAALQAMLRYGEEETDFESLCPILECLQEKLARVSPKIITPQLWEDAVREATAEAVAMSERAVLASKSKAASSSHSTLKKSSAAPSASAASTKGKNADWRVVDAFDTPTLVYDPLRQQFRYATEGGESGPRPSLLGTVEDKIEMVTQRYLRVQQRVVRYVSSVTSIDRLLGTSATSTQILLGMLRATSTSSAMAQAEGVAATGFELEDLTGSIPLHLHSSTTLDESGIYTEGCIVLVEGYYEDGIFVVNELTLPPIEAKAKSQPFIPPAPNTRHGSSSHASNASPMTVYTMTNVALDEPVILQQLIELVDNLRENMATQQVVLVLMGNFSTSSMTLPLALEELSRQLEPLPANHSVLIMPGPNDTPSMCWPVPPINAPSAFSQHLQANVQFVSNPCRLQYGEKQDILLFRQDMIRQHLQNEILSVRNSASPEKRDGKHSIATRILHTVLSQGHLLPQAPIYWNYDYALGMYPLPDLMLVGLEEGEENVKSFNEEDCQILAPGSNGNWAKVTLHPRHKRHGVRLPLQIEFSQNNGSDSEEDSVAESLMEED